MIMTTDVSMKLHVKDVNGATSMKSVVKKVLAMDLDAITVINARCAKNVYAVRKMVAKEKYAKNATCAMF